MNISTDVLQLRNRSVCIYKKKVSHKVNEVDKILSDWKKEFSSETNNKINNINKSAYSGNVTVHAQRRIRKACNILTQISSNQVIYNPITKKMFDFKLTFITLTIPDKVEVSEEKKLYNDLLKPLLKHLQQVYNMSSYIWKAEYQKRGVIHYHITTNVFIPYDKLRLKWNKLIYKNGLMKGYIKKYKSTNPNSTDIHKVYNDNSIEIYLEKYISKIDKENRSINGKVWDCSLNLKKAKLFTVELSPKHLTNITNKINSTVVKSFKHEYFQLYYFNEPIIHNILNGYEHLMYQQWQKVIIDGVRS